MTSSKASTSPFSSYKRRLATLQRRLAPSFIEGILGRGDSGAALLRQPAGDDDIINWFRLTLGRTPNVESIAAKRGMTVGELMATLLGSREFEAKALPALLGGLDLWRAQRPKEWGDLEDYMVVRFGALLEGNEMGRLDYLARVLAHRGGAVFRQVRALKGTVRAELLEDLQRAWARSSATAEENGLDMEAVRAVTMLFLGRYPNGNDDVRARAALGSPRLVKRLLSSAECDATVLQAILGGQALPHERVEPVPPEWLKAALARGMDLTPKARRAVRAAGSWASVLEVILKDERFERAHLSQKPGKPGFAAAARLKQARELLGADASALRDAGAPARVHASQPDVDAWGARAKRLLREGRIADAERLLASAAQSDSQGEWRALLATCLALRGAYLEALQALPEHPIQAGNPASAVFRRAGLLARQGEDSMAGALFRQCEAAGYEAEVAAFAAACLEGAEGATAAVRLPGRTAALPQAIGATLVRDIAGFMTEARAVPRPPVPALSGIPLEYREAVAWLVVRACITCFVHAEQVFLLLDKLDSQGALSLRTCLSLANESELLPLLTPALSHAQPDRVGDHDALLRVARYLELQGEHERASWFAVAAAESTPGSKDANRVASYLCERVGRFADAARFLRAASGQVGSDAPSLIRLAALERKLVTKDPTRDPSLLDSTVEQLLGLASERLSKDFKDDDARLLMARALVFAERFPEAHRLLSQLATDCVRADLREKAGREVTRVCERMGLTEDTYSWASREYELSPCARTAVSKAKALRALNRAEVAQSVLERHLDENDAELARETARNLFFVGRFGEAAALAQQLLERYPGDRHLLLYAAAAALEAGNPAEGLALAAKLELAGGREVFSQELALLQYALLKAAGDAPLALEQLNSVFEELGCQRIRFDESPSAPAFDRLAPTGQYPTRKGEASGLLFDGPLVSVIMTAYNAEAHIETAVRSILQQSYSNLELIVVDDASSDSTPELLMRLAATDSRVRPLLRTTNSGTYVSKNVGLLQARGEFVALQDSDDWSHPDRLAKVIPAFASQPGLVGLTTDWIRMTSEGDIVIKAGVQVAHVCCISLVFRRRPVLDALGFFDSVRIEADMEYIRRMRLAFGPASVLRLRWPLLLGRAHSASLTASEEFGITRTGFTKPRLDYQAAQRAWHAKIIEGNSPYMPFPLEERNFEAPAVMLP